MKGMTLELAGGARVLTDGEVNQIHRASMEVLERTGVVFKGEEALKVLGEHGAAAEPPASDPGTPEAERPRPAWDRSEPLR